jgi:hypothetical protein
MAGENIPIDYLSDHLKSHFEIIVSFQPGNGYLGIVRFDGREMYRSNFLADAQEAFDLVCHQIEDNYQEFLDT